MSTIRRLLLLFGLCIVAAIALSIFTGQGLSNAIDVQAGNTSSNEDISIYIPLVLRSPSHIYGNVTDNGSAAPSIPLELWHFDGVSSTAVLSTTTNTYGDYYFKGMDPLGPGESYWVRYENNDNPARLYSWVTRELTSFPDGSIVNLGSFDIANVVFVSPSPGVEIVPPSPFQWTLRTATPTDSYQFDLLDFYDLSRHYMSDPLGYVNSYNLGSLPAGFQYCNPYFWGVSVNSPDGGFGIAYWVYLVTLHQSTLSGIHGCVTENSVPVSGVTVELCRYSSGNSCTSRGTTTTSNGYFAFTGQPTLTSGQEYYVRFINESNSSRLYGYWTGSLSSYAAGSAVFIGDFDIKNIPLNLPVNSADSELPATFDWDSRPNTLWDDYEFDLFDPSDFDPYFYTDPSLGYEDNYSLEHLPPGFLFGEWYIWDIWVYGFWYGNGVSYEARWVGFSPSSMRTMSKETPALSRHLDQRAMERLHNKFNQAQPRLLPYSQFAKP